MSFEWKQVEGNSERIYTPKQEYFAWARRWSFAQPNAQKPEDFVYAVRCNIQDQAAAGFMIEVDGSKGDNLVYRKLLVGVQMDERQCEGLAKRVLNLSE